MVGGGHGDGEDSVLLGGGHTLQAAHIGELGVVGDDADGLGGVHGGAAADGHDAVGGGSLEGGHAVLYVFNGGVGLDVAVHFVGEAGGVQQIGDLGGHAELDQVGVGADESLFVAPAGKLGNDVFDSAVAVVGNGVENNTGCHNNISPFVIIHTRWIFACRNGNQWRNSSLRATPKSRAMARRLSSSMVWRIRPPPMDSTFT